LEIISSLESDVGVYVRVIVNVKLLYKTVNIVCFAHKDDIIGVFVINVVLDIVTTYNW